jgi:hypothetical protein
MKTKSLVIAAALMMSALCISLYGQSSDDTKTELIEVHEHCYFKYTGWIVADSQEHFNQAFNLARERDKEALKELMSAGVFLPSIIYEGMAGFLSGLSKIRIPGSTATLYVQDELLTKTDPGSDPNLSKDSPAKKSPHQHH